MTTNPNVAVAYLRVSTDDQQIGIEAQKAAITQFANRENILVVGWYVDEGISGATQFADRPALVAAFAELKKAAAGRLIVARLDRIARDVMISAMVERALSQCGAKLASADGVGSADGPEGELLRNMIYAFAQYERALIRLRTKAAMAVKKERGEPVGTAPYGYSYSHGKLVANEYEQRVIGRVQFMHSTNMSIRAIVRELAQGKMIFGRNGRPLSFSVVRAIVSTKLPHTNGVSL